MRDIDVNVPAHKALCAALGELLPEEASGDVFDKATRALRRGLEPDALRAAHALGGEVALLWLLHNAPRTDQGKAA